MKRFLAVALASAALACAAPAFAGDPPPNGNNSTSGSSDGSTANGPVSDGMHDAITLWYLILATVPFFA